MPPLSCTARCQLLPSIFQSPKQAFITSNVHEEKRKMSLIWWQARRHKVVPPAACYGTRKVVEHVYLIKAREDILEHEEKDMLDYLYTFQYHMNGIIAISLGMLIGKKWQESVFLLEAGRLSDANAGGFTHAAFMRFHRMDDLTKFYEKSESGVLKEHVTPYCHGLISVDFESEVEDDILPIFRRGEEFNYGVEFVLLISVSEDALGRPVEEAMANLAGLTRDFEPLIVQATQGSNINPDSKDYTHGAVIRFSSIEAFEAFTGSLEYKKMWISSFEPIARNSLAVSFNVDPVGTDIM